MSSAMRGTMWRQLADLRAILADRSPVESAAERLHGRRLFLVGTGTSWHAANHSAWFLRAAGVDARPVQGMDAAVYGMGARPDDGVVVLSHRNTKRFTTQVGGKPEAAGLAVVVVGGKARRTSTSRRRSRSVRPISPRAISAAFSAWHSSRHS